MLEYYVINYDHNKHRMVHFNIFDNIPLRNETLKIVEKYLKSPKEFKTDSREPSGKCLYGFEAFAEELRRLIAWQMWGRYEYEIVVTPFSSFENEPEEKWDAYKQCLPNINVIAREVIYQFQNGK